MSHRKIDEVSLQQDLDTTWKYRFTVKDADEVATNDAALTVEVLDPVGATVVYSIDEVVVITEGSTGVYDIELPVAKLGDWFVRIITSIGDTHTIYVPVQT